MPFHAACQKQVSLATWCRAPLLGNLVVVVVTSHGEGFNTPQATTDQDKEGESKREKEEQKQATATLCPMRIAVMDVVALGAFDTDAGLEQRFSTSDFCEIEARIAVRIFDFRI